jgi:hypothetical protein
MLHLMVDVPRTVCVSDVNMRQAIENPCYASRSHSSPPTSAFCSSMRDYQTLHFFLLLLFFHPHSEILMIVLLLVEIVVVAAVEVKVVVKVFANGEGCVTVPVGGLL